MAMQGGLIKDQNNLPYDGTMSGGKISIHNAQKKNITGIPKSMNSKTFLKSNQSNVSVRRILGDLTNSKKPQSHQASKKVQECKMDNIIMDDQLQVKTCENEGVGEPSKSVSCLKAKKVVQQTGVSRKALGDLTNSQIPSSIEHEGFMHNHNECIKARKRAEMMDMDYFLETIGQDKSLQFVSPPLVSFSKSYENDDDDLSYLKEWAVMPESPKSRNYSTKLMELEEDDGFLDSDWMVESCDFKLKESP